MRESTEKYLDRSSTPNSGEVTSIWSLQLRAHWTTPGFASSEAGCLWYTVFRMPPQTGSEADSAVVKLHMDVTSPLFGVERAIEVFFERHVSCWFPHEKHWNSNTKRRNFARFFRVSDFFRSRYGNPWPDLHIWPYARYTATFTQDTTRVSTSASKWICWRSSVHQHLTDRK